MASIKDVAREAGVSIATVYYVLNNTKPVSEATRQRVLEAVRKLGYRPSSIARGLQAGRARTLGYSWQPMPDDQLNPILDRFLQSMATVAARHEYHILAYPTSTAEDEVEFYRELIETQRVDGFILSNTNLNDPRIRFLMEAEVPFVAFGRANPEWDFPWVDVDGRAGLRKAVEHLAGLGHERIACLAWPEGSLTGSHRLAGYLEGMAAAGLPVDPAWVVRMEMDHDLAYRAVRRLLDLPPARRPTAVVTMTDLMAIGAMNAALDRGVEVGREFAVVGFDDIPLAPYLRPPLTSLRQPIVQVGERVVTLLMALLEGREVPQRQVLLEPELVVRASTVGPTDGEDP